MKPFHIPTLRRYGRFLALVPLLAMAVAVGAETTWPRMTGSADGVPISYEVHGAGEPTLVFVHGWSCDGRYWREQVSYFSRDHRVVVVDLAGHGHSGPGRENHTMDAYGQDVTAVLRDLDARQVVLIGHSMGGPVSVAAARRLPGSVLGIIGVDTFHDVGGSLSPEEAEAWLAPLREDFRTGAVGFVQQMFVDATDPELRNWIVADMAAAPPEVAISAMEEMLSDVVSGEALEAFHGLEVPIVAINADLWPTDVEANRRYLPGFEAVILEGTDHFLHMAEPEAFNRALAEAIAALTGPGERD
ncbi:MAG: alpha/beta hydrolase [Ectothiorhodospiraceae bacterium]|nr:alpha/beta hydrolase [Ectothiorhodospiraceae bacterium]